MAVHNAYEKLHSYLPSRLKVRVGSGGAATTGGDSD